ncbi:hypothetical protein CA267_016360 [Alteromonas pelagimontana]|uniref:Phasin family protein n=1 Tax=Alteromonas pelagimontana TaxID=1858656 RepID=A0A6M4MG98_9ALTE|nr:phasin family protein [Alteromonas pelagimontana]QJR82211.1 hypothetical protein CA267_016360 [Alteromonas pelagimontana]
MIKNDSVKSKISEAEDFARKIWLAGLGAYGKSVEEAQERYEKFSADTSKAFDDLVKKGENLEDDAKARFKETTNEVENRVSEVRQKMGLDVDHTDKKIEELTAKVDALTEAVAKLIARS